MNKQDYSVKLPEFRKAKIELFKLLNLNDLAVLLTCFDIESNSETNSEFLYVQPILNVRPKSSFDKKNEYKTFSRLISHQLRLNYEDKQTKIIIDQYFYLVKFSLENSFNKEQISCLLTILKNTHDLAVDTSFGNLDETFDYFKNSMLIHSVHRPPFSLQIFSTKQLELVFNYIFNSYFKQFKFYKYVFSDAIKLNVKFQYSNQIDLIESSRKSNLTFNEESLNKIEESEKIEEQQEQINKENLEKNELREFIRNYLGDQLDKMKREITDEFNLGANEQQQKAAVKPVSASKNIKKSAKKK